MTLAKTLRKIRELRGISQTVLAERAGLSESTIYRLESGGRVPSVAAAEAIGKALDVPAGIFAGPGWLGLVERMGASVRPGLKPREWWASTNAGLQVGSGRTPEIAVMALYEQWSKEKSE